MSTTISQFEEIFIENRLYKARMISGSKSGYRKRHPYNTVIFNAKVYDSLENTAKPIWYGDLDINNDGTILKNIANTLGKTLYVVYESGTNTSFGIAWDTSQTIPVVTPQYISLKIKEEEEYLKKLKVTILKRIRKELLENKEYETVDLVNGGLFERKIEFPQKLLEYELEEFYKIVAIFKRNPKKVSPRFNKYFSEYGYFTSYFLEIFLKRELHIEEGYMINPSAIWISRGLNKKLRAIDLEIEKVFDIKFNYSKFGRYVTCNYCVEDLYYLNEKNMNQNSYENGYLYIRDGYKKESMKFIK